MGPEYAALEAAYAAAVLSEQDEDGWRPLAVTEGPWLVVTAANPWSLTLTPAINAARDLVLHAELVALGLNPRRVRAADPDGDWQEDGWLVPHDDALATVLMRRYQQAGVYVLRASQRTVLWATENQP